MNQDRVNQLVEGHEKGHITQQELQDELVYLALCDGDLVTREPVIAALRAATTVPDPAPAAAA